MSAPGCLSLLLIEDNDDDVIFLMRCFKKANLSHRVSRVSDGIEAMKFLLKTAPYENADSPNLILLDLNMPRKDGYSVLRDVKNNPDLSHIPVVVFTSTKQESEIRRCYALGASSFIPKLNDFDELKSVIATFNDYWEKVARIPESV